MSEAALEAVLRRDRAVVMTALITVAALAWAYLLRLSPEMSAMDMGAMMMPHAVWTAANLLFTFAMWAVMMVGMMTPSVAPMILLYARVGRQAKAAGTPFAAAAWFASGYLLAWMSFALAAACAQLLLQQAALLTPELVSVNTAFAGVILIAAGAMQWSPLKDVCLRQCQSPLLFIQEHGGFRGEPLGALRLGLQHGGYCIGCCWALMALLFVGGVMNLLWVAGLAILVLLEKALPAGRLIARIAGAAFVIAGIWLLAGQAIL